MYSYPRYEAYASKLRYLRREKIARGYKSYLLDNAGRYVLRVMTKHEFYLEARSSRSELTILT